jgi:hypothetical protein
MQDQENSDFKSVWSDLHEDIVMVCSCGNHGEQNLCILCLVLTLLICFQSDPIVRACSDVGNRPTRASIEKFNNAFGDDHLAFWTNGSYDIILNTSLFSNPSGAADMLFKDQLHWLEERLKHARAKEAINVFVFGHHPWFLHDGEEKEEDLKATSPHPVGWGPREGGFPDSCFVVPKHHRKPVMDLFEECKVSAAFSGHFHQNFVSKASFGMEMMTTSSLSMVSTARASLRTTVRSMQEGFVWQRQQMEGISAIDSLIFKDKHDFCPVCCYSAVFDCTHQATVSSIDSLTFKGRVLAVLLLLSLDARIRQ